MADQVSFIFENMFFNIYFHRDGFNICGRTKHCTEALEDEISSLILDDSSSDDDSKLVELVNIILCSIFGVYMCLEITLMFLPDSFCKPISTFNFMMGPCINEVNMAEHNIYINEMEETIDSDKEEEEDNDWDIAFDKEKQADA